MKSSVHRHCRILRAPTIFSSQPSFPPIAAQNEFPSSPAVSSFAGPFTLSTEQVKFNLAGLGRNSQDNTRRVTLPGKAGQFEASVEDSWDKSLFMKTAEDPLCMSCTSYSCVSSNNLNVIRNARNSGKCNSSACFEYSRMSGGRLRKKTEDVENRKSMAVPRVLELRRVKFVTPKIIKAVQKYTLNRNSPEKSEGRSTTRDLKKVYCRKLDKSSEEVSRIFMMSRFKKRAGMDLFLDSTVNSSRTERNKRACPQNIEANVSPTKIAVPLLSPWINIAQKNGTIKILDEYVVQC